MRSADDVERERANRQARAAEKQAWEEFLTRIRNGQTAPDDERYLKELDDRAFGTRPDSRILKELSIADSPEKAHDLLLKLQRWDHTINPYPHRANIVLSPPEVDLPTLPEENY